MELKIEDNKSAFYQWDTGQKLIAEDADGCAEVHFCRSGEETALVCPIRQEGDKRVADVPNILLQTDGQFWAYLFLRMEDGSQTIHGNQFAVNARPKPESYVYTETEVLDYGYLARRLEKLEGEGIGQAVEAYLKENPPEGSGGLNAAQIAALDNMFKVCAFTKADVSAEYNAFCSAFGIDGGIVPDEPDTPAVTLTGISATYSGGDVSVGTAVNDLSGIVVTARYSDGTSATVTEYTLSGTIAEGSNTMTVTYQGMTATFAVTGVAESGGEVIDTTAEFNETDVVLANANKTQNKTGYSATRPYDLGYSIAGTASEFVVYFLPGTDSLPSGQYNKIHEYLNGTYVTYMTGLGYNEEKKTLIEGRYGEANQLRFAFATDRVDDAYAYMETSGKVLFAGKNTPYYGMSNISQAQE